MPLISTRNRCAPAHNLMGRAWPYAYQYTPGTNNSDPQVKATMLAWARQIDKGYGAYSGAGLQFLFSMNVWDQADYATSLPQKPIGLLWGLGPLKSGIAKALGITGGLKKLAWNEAISLLKNGPKIVTIAGLFDKVMNPSTLAGQPTTTIISLPGVGASIGVFYSDESFKLDFCRFIVSQAARQS